jgi:hypothetical protein
MKTIYMDCTLLLMMSAKREKEVGSLLIRGEQKITKTEVRYLMIEENDEN